MYLSTDKISKKSCLIFRHLFAQKEGAAGNHSKANINIMQTGTLDVLNATTKTFEHVMLGSVLGCQILDNCIKLTLKNGHHFWSPDDYLYYCFSVNGRHC